MDQLIYASLSHIHYWHEVGMLKVPAIVVHSELKNIMRTQWIHTTDGIQSSCQPFALIPPKISRNVGRFAGILPQHDFAVSAKLSGAVSGITGRSPTITTRMYKSLSWETPAHGTSLVSTSHTTIPKLYTSLANEEPPFWSTCPFEQTGSIHIHYRLGIHLALILFGLQGLSFSASKCDEWFMLAAKGNLHLCH